jgi:hypothetical protein
MPDERPPDDLSTLLSGMFWPQAMVQGAGRAQAAAAADALRRINAPMVAALERQREAAEALARMAEQMAAMAEQVGKAARTWTGSTRPGRSAIDGFRCAEGPLPRAVRPGIRSPPGPLSARS